VGKSRNLEARNQIFGLALRPDGPNLTLSGEVRRDIGGFRTNLYRVGARAVLSKAVEASITYQPSRLSQPREIRLGVSLRGTHGDAHLTARPIVEDRVAEYTVGISGRKEALAEGIPGRRAKRLVAIDASGPLYEESPGFSLLGGSGRPLRRVLDLLRQAEEDPGVRGVLLRVDSEGRGLLGPVTAP